MNAVIFTQQVKAMSDRLTSLYQGISTSAPLSPTLLPSALKELGVASERLQIAAKMLHQQHQKLSFAEQNVETERQCYRELLEFIPDACLLTDTAGVIQEANRAAAKLLNLPQSSLIGKFITAFIADETWQHLQSELHQLQRKPRKQEWQIRLQPYQGIAVNVSVFLEVSRQEATQLLTIRWLLRHQSDRAPVQPLEQLHNYVALDYPVQLYHKGETIPLDPQVIWQVVSGLVKLTTFSRNGQAVLVGLAGAKAPFGPSLTALPLYEATALANTQLRSIPLIDFATSPSLKQCLLPQISQRLKQTELLLAVCGQPRVADRLESLLNLLKQEIGQPVADGTRLSVRLTHEDLATACCTTRVTITRLLSKLQQQQKLSVDSQHHFIVKNLS